MSDDIYKPPGCETLDKLPDGQIRFGIQGPPFSGKTTAALTFPNPIILSFDRKTNAHIARADVINVPFYDPLYVDTIVKRDGIQCPCNRKDALLVWLDKHGSKLSNLQTLIIDGNTGIDEAYQDWWKQNPQLGYTQGGQVNKFKEFTLKNEFFADIHVALKALKCHVVYICHETPERDKSGELTGKVRPLLSGQAGDKLASNMTDFLRAIVVSKPKNDEQVKKCKEWAGIDDATLKEWIASTPPHCQSIYLWQTQEDEIFDGGTSSMFAAPKFILANYNSFAKYKRKTN